jgi:hypothetical protein
MRRLRRNHQKQPIIDLLGAAPASRRRAALGASRVTAAPVPTSWLRAAPGVLRVTTAPVPTSRFRTALRPACVPWAPAPTSRHRAASGAPRVLTAPGRIKTVEPSNTENRAVDDFFSTHLPAQGSSGGSACPRNSGPNENRQVDAENLAESGRCKATPIRSKRSRAQRVAADSYQIDPDPRW